MKKPTQFQLAQLAAMLPSSERFQTEDDAAAERVSVAVGLWKAAGVYLKDESFPDLTLDEILRRNVVGSEASQMLVGNHYLPALDEDFFKGSRAMPTNEFMEKVIGLSNHRDRTKWFKAFTQSDVFSDLTKRSPLFEIIGPFVPEAERQRKRKDAMDRILATEIDRSLVYVFAKGYREWRRTMKTPNEKADKPFERDECIYLGLKKLRDNR